MFAALPDYEPQLFVPDRNLAGYLGEEYATQANTAQPYPTPPRTLYRAWDGTPIGFSSNCDPTTAIPGLSGFDGLDGEGLQAGAQWAAPLLLGALAFTARRGPLESLAWALGAYLAPLPAAGAWVFLQMRR